MSRDDSLVSAGGDFSPFFAELFILFGNVDMRGDNPDGANLNGIAGNENFIRRRGYPISGRRDHAIGIGDHRLAFVFVDEIREFLRAVHRAAGRIDH